METVGHAKTEFKDPSLLLSSLHLLVPPLQLMSAAMWQVVQQQHMVHYGKLEEFVSLVMGTVPELLSDRQRTQLTVGLRERMASPVEIESKTDTALQVVLWELLSRLEQLLPVPDLRQPLFAPWMSVTCPLCPTPTSEEWMILPN
ncbi:hypothetical protein AGOR_G00172070 [Albula goreensis]|uniref:TERF1-interacting nuclear factor 2 N-terminal domain-containing protein n=1 Tax=Albula goreensis TaxID=1534307 RepID=A0A8T3CU50_9TELE|nr:hypothetical protein AGOR_G00172070 [Albula goreensis]